MTALTGSGSVPLERAPHATAGRSASGHDRASPCRCPVSNSYPLPGDLHRCLDVEHGFDRLLDFGVIRPRFADLYDWSAADEAHMDRCMLPRSSTRS